MNDRVVYANKMAIVEAHRLIVNKSSEATVCWSINSYGFLLIKHAGLDLVSFAIQSTPAVKIIEKYFGYGAFEMD